jgi:hypothetical protein
VPCGAEMAPKTFVTGSSRAAQRVFTGPLAAAASIPVEEPPPSAPSKKGEGGRPGQGFPAFLAFDPRTASNAADESGAGRIRPAAS